MPHSSMPNLRKQKPIRKIYTTTTKVTSRKYHITHNFLALLRKVAYPQQPRPTNPLISFLNINNKRPETSLSYIPSIQNMLSEQQIAEEGQLGSISSIQRGFSSEVVSEGNLELRILYVCLLERVMRQLQYQTSESQRKKIIRGTWNVFVKYFKDHNYFIFADIGTNIEWGLLELINFNFHSSFRERCQAQFLLKGELEPSSSHSLTLQ